MHVLLQEESVTKVVEELGASLDVQCVRAFGEDATYNVSKLISTAQTLQRAERAHHLTVRHVQQAARLLGTAFSPGIATTTQTLNRLQISDTQSLYYPVTTDIDLYDMTHGETSECTAAPLALEISLTSEYPNTIDTLPPSLYRYLTLLCEQVVSKDTSLRNEALAEIQSSKRIALVLPYLIQFVELKLRDNTLLADNTLVLLSCYKQVLQNKAIYLEPYTESLLDVCYSMCCDWTDSRETANNPTSIIEHSSDIAAVIILQYDNDQRNYYTKYTRYCTETIESDEISLSALGSLSLLTKLGPRSVEENIVPLIFGLYDTVFSETVNTPMTDRTALHIERVLKLALHSFYNVIYKALHNTKVKDLVDYFNAYHNSYSTISKAESRKLSAPKPPPQVTTTLTYNQILDKLGPACCSMIAPSWPHMTRHPTLLTKKMTREMRKKLKDTFARFGSTKGKMMPVENKIHIRKQTDRQIKSKQIYELHNNFTPLAYFL